MVLPDEDQDPEILVVFHNLKGFDGMFILHELYQQQQEVTDQLTVGAKVLSFRSRPIKFIDSLCFLPMPLASFSSTFNLTELKKGFFPHLFNTPEHQHYVARIPDLEFYDPDGMMEKNKLEHWHSDQVRRNVVFDFHRDMVDMVNLWSIRCRLVKSGLSSLSARISTPGGVQSHGQVHDHCQCL